MSNDPFQGRAPSEGAPYDNALTVTPNDTADLPVIPSAIHIPYLEQPDGSGVIQDAMTPRPLRLVMQNGEELTILAQGMTLDCKPLFIALRPKRIMATGTDAVAVTLLW
ncbi:hypothetical protein [Rhodobacter sp. 24-YEA-8]|uniref:spike base protein, RCAP_Rcc01079 family n=1 Tax=Rhodobacter sp. 24-YEA-8 TaxID=1884310 RepID=UPI00089849F0|nr:hypothetical protein [Rhodobacter sp. 24-YEA-8]SEB62212.1 hypothetical protein SAMN05519105_0938 [Rhodobacter sp. 24-YEA-8]